ncbi:MAG: hypothetical protein H0Z24_08970 [Thermosipho sp. (in: Bacteria)]|nr:hypothetical protein [Thermosipho sp. (in: thermotogales)]
MGENNKNIRRISQFILLSGSIILLIFEIAILVSTEPRGYDITIYHQLPTEFWYAHIMSYFVAAYLILKGSNKLFVKLEMLVVLVNYITFLLVPHVLGYVVVNRLDPLTNMGMMRAIITEGHIVKVDIYPANQIIYVVTSIISNYEIDHLTTTLPVVFSLFFITSTYILSKVFVTKQHKQLLFLIVTMYFLRYYHLHPTPHFTSYSIAPIGLFLLYKHVLSKNHELPINIALATFFLAVPFQHPFIVILFAYILMYHIVISKDMDLTPYLIVMSIVFIIWLTSSDLLIGAGDIIKTILQGEEPPRPPALTQGTNAFFSGISKVSLYDLFLFINLLYGRYLIPGIIIGISILRLNNRRSLFFITKKYKIVLFTLILSILDAFLLINPYITHVFERLTTLNFFVYGLIPLFTLSLDTILKRYKPSIVVALILTLIMALTLFGTYPSPLVFNPNRSIAYNEIIGAEWLFSYKETPYYVIDFVDPIDTQAGYRFLTFFYINANDRMQYSYSDIPPHFGYPINATSLYKNSYILISTQDRNLEKVRIKVREKPMFVSEDFEKLNTDSKINKIYQTLNIEIYRPVHKG